ncbi:hypothetical protein Q5752_001205 [Cryptotrichosporon argae]
MATHDFTLSGLFSVVGLHVLITGAGTGIGFYMAKGFAANGAIVYIVGRRREVLERAQAELEALKAPAAEVHIFVADVSDREQVTRLVAGLPRLDVLINNAGTVIPDPPHTHLTPPPELQAALLASPASTWADTFRVNVEAPYFLSASAAHLLAAAPAGGRIINVSSIGATMCDPAVHQPAYQASKAALDHLTRLLASKLRALGIRVNAIAPGYFPSQMNDPANPKSMLAKATELVPLQRGGEEEDAAGTAIWLASRAGSYVHGEVIPLAGGRNWA